MRSTFLLDVNVLVAMVWPPHVGHGKVLAWLSHHRPAWATCPLTQIAAVRLLSNPAFSPNAYNPANALALLQGNLDHPSHTFWADDLSLIRALEPPLAKLTGHQQITDAYLLGLAIHKKGKLATMDRGIVDLLPEKKRASEFVELI